MSNRLRELSAEVRRTYAEYQTAQKALATYSATLEVSAAKEMAADPATIERVRDLVEEIMMTQDRVCVMWNSVTLAHELTVAYANMPSSKTLQNVYLPAIRATCPHAVQSGRQWLWYLNAAKSVEG